MQRSAIIILLFIFASCKSKKEDTPASVEEKWALTEKNRYDYKLNTLGHPDTTFIYTYKYKDGNVVDSSYTFTVGKYKGDFLSDEIAFTVGKDSRPSPFTSTHYEFDSKGRMVLRRVSGAGKLVSEERYNYNEFNLLVKSTAINIKPYDQLTGKGLELTTASSGSLGYDTLTTLYEYDDTKKVTGTKFINNSGDTLSRDVNLYAGNAPLLSASINSKGDTTKKVTFEAREKMLMTVTETDSFVLFQNFMNGVQVAQKTKYKNRNEQWRSAVKYNSKGRKEEESLYKLL